MPENTINFDIKLVVPHNLERFSEMANASLGLKADSRYFKWKYLDNPAGQVLAFEAAHEGEPASFYGVIPEIYLVRGQPIKIYQSMDTMTHPKYQKRGLFTKLAKATYDYILETEGNLTVVGIPGGNSFHGFVNKIGWKHVHNFRYFFLHKAVFSARTIFRRRSVLSFQHASEMTPDVAQYFQKRQPSRAPISNHIHADFFNWRVFQNPYKGFQVVIMKDADAVLGLCVYKIQDNGRCFVHLLDFLRRELFEVHTASIIRHLFEKTSSQYVYTWEPLEETIHNALKRCGFIKNPYDRGPFSYRI